MGHMVGKDLYRKLGKKIDGLTARSPWNDTLYEILTELYSAEEAEVAVRMPYGMHPLSKIAEVTGMNQDHLRKILNGLADKGLVLDIKHGDKYFYTLSPMVVGIFEFTMMRIGEGTNSKKWARLFNDYISDDNTFYKANMKSKTSISPLRALPYAEAIDMENHVEVLDYEKASYIIDSAHKYAVGICSCRHEKMHTGEKKCDVPLELCASFNEAADYLIRHNLAKEISKSEAQENLERSKEMRLVLSADNVKKNISFICNCCGCCCNVLLGISKFGYPNTLVTSRFIANHQEEDCSGCGDCAEACPINAITMTADNSPVIDKDICVGCGVCALECETDSMKLKEREQKVFYPEDTFERVILTSLSNGTLQNLIFNNPQSKSQGFMRAVVGGFLKLPPVKKAIMSDSLRSRFLSSLRNRH